MAVRNEKISGSDFVFSDTLYAEDLNDTFDKIVEIVDAGN